MPIPDVVQMLPSFPNVFGAFVDRDNATCWLFQYQAGGFAHCSMTDGSVLFQGNIFNNPAAVLDYHATATPFWAQDNQGFYYSAFGSVIYKLEFGAGPLTDFGNGYLATVATLDLNPLGAAQIIGWTLDDVTGLLMLADALNNRLIVIDTGIMNVLGTYVIDPAQAKVTAAPFLDAGGGFWAVFSRTDYSVDLVKWTPASKVAPFGGVSSGGALIAKSTHIALAPFGVSAQIQWAHYAPHLNAVVMGNHARLDTGQLVTIGLFFFNCIAFALASAVKFYCGTPDAPDSAMIAPAVSYGSLSFPIDTGNDIQVGGLVAWIDPESLRPTLSYDVTQEILGDGFTVPVAVQPGRGPNPIPTPFANFIYNEVLDRVLVTYQFSGSAAYSVKIGINGTQGASLGLADVRSYCQAYGIFISGVMDTQKPAKDWLTDLCDIANCAPVWNGSQLSFVPRCEVSAVGNGAIYTAPTSGGPVADLDDSIFIKKEGLPPVRVTRKRITDATNVYPIEHTNRLDSYNHAVTPVRDQAEIYKRAALKASVRALHFIHDQATAIKVGFPLLRRMTMIERLEFSFTVPKNWSWLDPYDLVTLTDPILDMVKIPVRLTSIKETGTFDLDCTAEPFYFGAHAPSSEFPAQVPLTTSFNQNQSPGSVNPPVIFEAVARLNQFQNQGAIWVMASGANPNYGGAAVFMSVDGGTTYEQVGVLNGNMVLGTLTADFPAVNDPDTVDTLAVDISESFNQKLNSFTTVQRDGFVPQVYLAGGGTITVNGQNLVIPYELISYATATLISGGLYNLPPTIRRGIFGTPVVDHPPGSQFAFIDTTLVLQIPLDPANIGRTLFFKFCAFNIFLQEQQDISDPAVIAYSFTPTGKVGGSQIVNQNQNYTTTPAQVVFQGIAGGIPGHPTFTDPTKVYVITPFTVNFASGPVSYAGPYGPVTIPGTTPETIFVSVQDPQHTGTGSLFVDTDSHNYNSSGFTKIGQLFIKDTSTGGAAPQTAQRNMYPVTPAPDGTNLVFLITAFPTGPYVDVYINGVLQDPTVHYLLIGNQLNFTQAPQSGDDIKVVF